MGTRHHPRAPHPEPERGPGKGERHRDQLTKPDVPASRSGDPPAVVQVGRAFREGFTGAERRREGRFEQANGGTLLLDEIGEIPPATQVKLLRVLQERSFERVGGNQTIDVDVRLIAATNRDVGRMVAEGKFREDLFYRLNVVHLHVPALRERSSDILPLATHFLRRYAEENGREVQRFSDAALRRIVEHLFVLQDLQDWAYEDRPAPIGHGQTISQPFMVALMVEALELSGHERVLEIGTGSGYEAAVLSRLVAEVWTVEIVPELASTARDVLDRLACRNVHVVVGDGSLGLEDHAPYDAIVVAAGSPSIPGSLVRQLREGGRLVVPVGPRGVQRLLRVRRQGFDTSVEELTRCTFVPLLGEHGWGADRG